MKVSEAFLVNTNNFDAIIKALVNYDEEEPIIDSDLMEELGYSDPNDLLVVRLLKDLDVINNEGEAAEHYHEFRDPETTKKALGKGIVSAYEDLFREHPHIHKSQDEIKRIFEEIFRDKKTDLIIKYISGTFKKLISFVGLNTIDDLLPDDGFEQKEPAEPVEGEEDTREEQSIIETEASDTHEDKTEEETDYSEYAPPELNGNHDQEEENEQEEETSAPTLAEAFENGQAGSAETDDTDASVVEFENDVVETVDEKTETAVETETKTGPSEQPSSENESNPSPSNTGNPMEELSKTTDKELNTDDSLVQKALFRKFDLVYKMERWEDLLQTADEIISRYDDHPELEKKVVQAITRRADALLELERPSDALEPVNNIIDRFSDSENEQYYEQASQALMLKAQILEDQGEGDLLGLYDTIVDRFESGDGQADNEKLNQIILKRFEIVLEEKEEDKVLEACSSLISRFKGNEEHKDHLHTAMIKRAEILDEMDRDEEALEAYNEFLSAFGS